VIARATPDTAALERERRLLWAIAYRMTGVAADADDVVQETFARAVMHRPSGVLRPWLVKVAMNAARDVLRKRKRTEYVGPWLPSPVEDDALDLADHRPSPELRYSIRESATFAFLIAVEALTPQRRAALILRDVFDYSTEETADALGISTDAVKQNLARARRALAHYDAGREPLDQKYQRDERAMSALFFALARGDTDAVEELLSDDVEAHSDGGGVYTAARVILRGPEQVARVYANLTKLAAPSGFALRSMNGAPAAVVTLASDKAHIAPTTVFRVETDARGKIVRIESIMAPRKLTALPH
jgi:RNA polymerase sigma-70 factor (ECF subfamily)